MPTLEGALRARLTEPRALLAAISADRDRLLLTFGAIGSHPRIVLAVSGEEISVLERPAIVPPTRRESTPARPRRRRA